MKGDSAPHTIQSSYESISKDNNLAMTVEAGEARATWQRQGYREKKNDLDRALGTAHGPRLMGPMLGQRVGRHLM